MKKTKVEVLSQENMNSHVLKITPEFQSAFYVPVIDVRDGDTQRKAVNNCLKDSNGRAGSKFMKPSYSGLFGQSYNDSVKNTTV